MEEKRVEGRSSRVGDGGRKGRRRTVGGEG
jgi:hypothetical protein